MSPRDVAHSIARSRCRYVAGTEEDHSIICDQIEQAIVNAGAALSSELSEAMSWVRKLEWVTETGDRYFCDECGMSKEQGHEPRCPLAAFLAEHG